MGRSLQPLDSMTLESQRLTEHILLTCGSGSLPEALAEYILKRDPNAILYIVGHSPLDGHDRVHCLDGDVARMDLGFAGQTYQSLLEQVTLVYHFSSLFDDKGEEEKALQAADNVVRFCNEATRLNRLVHWSGLALAGNMGVLQEKLTTPMGRIAKDEATIESLFLSIHKRLPVTILRPSYMLGMRGFRRCQAKEYKVLKRIVDDPRAVPKPVASRYRLHVVPLGFAVDLGYQLSYLPFAASRIFHITDPHPPTLQRVRELQRELYPDQRYAHQPVRELLASLFTPRPRRLSTANTVEALASMSLRFPPFEHFAHDLIDEIRRT